MTLSLTPSAVPDDQSTSGRHDDGPPRRLAARLAAPAEDLGDTAFDISTTACDRLRAMVRLTGTITADAAVLLTRVLDDHQRAGRRYLRVDLRGVRALCPDALRVVHRAHDTLLQRRGTLILTGVDERVERLVRAGDPEQRLFLVAPTADQLSPPPLDDLLPTAG